jgi:hypothetical protein
MFKSKVTFLDMTRYRNARRLGTHQHLDLGVQWHSGPLDQQGLCLGESMTKTQAKKPWILSSTKICKLVFTREYGID